MFWIYFILIYSNFNSILLPYQPPKLSLNSVDIHKDRNTTSKIEKATKQ